MTLSFRPATPADATFVATVMMEAVGHPVMEENLPLQPHMTTICQRDDTLYSWRNATIATIGGKPVAALIAYEGKGYMERRRLTFSLVPPDLPFDPETMDAETCEGEYYLDSLAVLPTFRGRGIGAALLRQGIATARSLSLTPVLACDPDNAPALALYRRLGFVTDGRLFIFGEDYLRMVIRP